MPSEFDRSLQRVLVFEGGYSNHPLDKGGATNQGVTQAVYDTYRRGISQPARSVKQLEPGERDSIYRMRYWALAKCDQLPAGVSYVVFDGAVNSGVSQSIKWLQRAVGVPADGVIGPQTIQAVRDYPSKADLVDRICDQRMAFLRALKTWSTFGKGWTSRVTGVRATGKAWATAKVAPPERPATLEGGVKAKEEDAKSKPSAAPGDIATGGGIVTTTIAQATEQLTPLSNIEFVGKMVAILTVAGVVLFAGGIAYRWWAKRRAGQIKDALS